jgi:hypothetical protein
VDLAHVLEYLSLDVLVKTNVLHGDCGKLDLFIELRGPAAQAVQDDIHGADNVSMNELTDNHEERHDDRLVGVRRDHVSPVKDAH